MIPKATVIRLDRKTRSELEGWLRASTTEQRMVRRARIVLLAADGWASRAIARKIGVMTGVVSVWRTRFAASGIDGLKDKPRPGAKPIYTEATGKRILAVLDQPVPKGRARWTCELVAEALGDVDVNYVRRFLRKQKIDLAGRKSWCESNDPEFAAKAADVVGLYLAPPRNAIVIWLARHPKVTFHYTPTRASWLNQVEGWFSILQGQSLSGASFTSVEQLREHIDAFIDTYNEDAEPFAWTKSEVHQRRVKGRRISEL
jgi:transposase